MKSSRLLMAAFAAVLISAPVLAAPPTASEVTVPAGAQHSRQHAKMMALLPTPELRMMFKMEMRQATRQMDRAQKKAYRKQEMQKIRAMNDAQKEAWRQDLQARWNALPPSEQTRIAQKAQTREARRESRRNRRDQGYQPATQDDSTGTQDMGTPQ